MLENFTGEKSDITSEVRVIYFVVIFCYGVSVCSGNLKVIF